MRRIKIRLFVLLLTFISVNAFAQSMPLQGMSMRLVTRDPEMNEIGNKTIVVSRTETSIKVTWFSLIKEFDEEAYYPTFKVHSRKGLIETDSLDQKSSFYQPMTWGTGYIRSDATLPLWVDPAYLELKGKNKRKLNVGLLDVNRSLIRLAPDKVFETLSYFQNLYEQYVYAGKARTDVNINRRDAKLIDAFSAEFFFVRLISTTKAGIYVDGKKQDYEIKMIGNDYYQLGVLDDPSNPLIISFRIYPDKAPKVFRDAVRDLQKYFEFRITQLTMMGNPSSNAN